jgi:hypothetical protein
VDQNESRENFFGQFASRLHYCQIRFPKRLRHKSLFSAGKFRKNISQLLILQVNSSALLLPQMAWQEIALTEPSVPQWK